MRAQEFITEGLRDPKDNPCWKGYKPVGTKQKGGHTVPNCVPVKEEFSDSEDHLSPELAQHILDKFKANGANALEKSLEWGDGAAVELRELLINALEQYIAGEALEEAEYQGRKVPLNKPMRGDVKKFKVYVKDPKTGNVKKVNFGHGGTSAKRAGQKTMSIKKSNPKRRKSFRARHHCENPGPKTKARYWSCKAW